MLDWSDIATSRAVRLLFEGVDHGRKPIAFWIGAGVSSWCGYPRWPDLADEFHSEFSRYEPAYVATRGLELLNQLKFPEFFEVCKEANSQRYYSRLSSSFAVREPTAIYRRFIGALSRSTPACVLTTNVDELLEKNIPAAATINRTSMERATEFLDRSELFVCKLHGSISDLESMVFTAQDYEQIANDGRYLTLLGRVLSRTSVVFLGYGLQDHHVLATLQRNHDVNALFGDGPHFAVTSSDHLSLPPSVRPIRYLADVHTDHRSAISVVEELGDLRAPRIQIDERASHVLEPRKVGKSAHLLFDVLPPGRWTTSQTVELEREDGTKPQFIVGTGFTDWELPNNPSTAMHDVIVGLLCFDQVVAPIQSVGRLHSLIGSDRFWALVREEVISFVNWSGNEGIMFPDSSAVASGDLVSVEVLNPDHTESRVKQAIREHLGPAPGKEAKAEELFGILESKIRTITREEGSRVPDIVRGLLLRPSVRRLLGVSGGTPLKSLARWQVFPVLRLTSVVKIGVACRAMGLSSAKLDYGTAKLAGPAFASSAGEEWTDDAASYVVCGRFAADVGGIVIRNPSILDVVLSFRVTSQGRALREEVLARLAKREGGEVEVAVNSALRAGLPVAVLQAARDEFVGLLVSEMPNGGFMPAIWNDRRYADYAIGRWKMASRRVFEEWCRRIGVGMYDPCPCQSGERVRFCCNEALKE